MKIVQVCLIASNSADSIEKTLKTWLFVDRICVYLNNSTDGTREILSKLKKKFKKKIFIFEGEFKNFSYARNKILDLSYDESYKYTLMIDDSYEFGGDQYEFIEELKNINYVCMDMLIKRFTEIESLSYPNKRIILTKSKIRYKNEVHEELNSNSFYCIKNGFLNDIPYEKHLLRTLNRKKQDLKMLENKEDERSLYYKAMTLIPLYYNNMATLEEVTSALIKRLDLDDIDYEQKAQCSIHLGHITNDAKFYINAALLWPDRAGECYYFASRLNNNFLKNMILNYSIPKNSRLPYDVKIYTEKIPAIIEMLQ